jgi:16S rRNA (guanine966-N2)-methyltransferase
VTRIIAGKARGRRLLVPPGEGTRPTSDRAREALFSSLDSQFNGFGGRTVLDLFAGSGAIGLEALSRGAKHATFVESDRKAAGVIGKNIAAVAAGPTCVINERVEVAVANAANATVFGEGGYDLVFIDPPYGVPDVDVTDVLTGLTDNGWLHDGTVVVLERSSRSPAFTWPAPYEPTRSKAYGEAEMHYAVWYVRGAADQ